jgi:sugar-specific transcriptional regulator TrmB/DNA-binding CsgD family transcriptional regulator
MTQRFVLTAFGLSDAADRVWRVLLRTPDVTPAEVSTRARLPFTDAARAVDELAVSGFVHPGDVPVGWLALDPAVAVEQRIAREQRQLVDRLEALSQLRAELARVREPPLPRQDMEILEGLDNIRGWLADASATMRSEALHLHTAGTAAGNKWAKPIDFALLARGMEVRTLVDAKSLDVPEHIPYYEALSLAGEQIRTVESVPTRVTIVDREVAILAVDAKDVTRAAVIVRAPMIIDSLVVLFERLWQNAQPICAPPRVPDRPVGRPARVLELLAAGLRDESVARSLAVGVRTVRRDVATLMATLGEQTRPAMVAAAVRHGWLTP